MSVVCVSQCSWNVTVYSGACLSGRSYVNLAKVSSYRRSGVTILNTFFYFISPFLFFIVKQCGLVKLIKRCPGTDNF